MLTTIIVPPAATRRSMAWSISALPRTWTSGFGRSLVSGRIRVPGPAARIIDRGGPVTSNSFTRSAHGAGDRLVIPRFQRAKGRMLEVAVQIAPNAREIGEIA